MEEPRRELPSVGVDVGGVLIAIAPGATDTMFSGDHRAAAAVPGAFEGVATLVRELGADKVFIISKAGAGMAQRTLEWMEAQRFHECTGVLPRWVARPVGWPGVPLAVKGPCQWAANSVLVRRPPPPPAPGS
jgi:hypothetical protein